MSLDLSSLIKAIDALDLLLKRLQDNDFIKSVDEITLNGLKAGVIQHFEFTYELCWKFIGRWIRMNKTPEDANHPRTRKELFRFAARYGLIDNPNSWYNYGDARNLTSHTYDEDTAETVYEMALPFLNDAKILLQRLVEYND